MEGLFGMGRAGRCGWLARVRTSSISLSNVVRTWKSRDHNEDIIILDIHASLMFCKPLYTLFKLPI